jgi:hypothetical protein
MRIQFQGTGRTAVLSLAVLTQLEQIQSKSMTDGERVGENVGENVGNSRRK